MESIHELVPLVGVTVACGALGIPRSSYYRAQRPLALPRLAPPRRPHPRALSSDEQAAVRDVLNSERFVDRAPRAIYATLLDEGIRHRHHGDGDALGNQHLSDCRAEATGHHVVFQRQDSGMPPCPGFQARIQGLDIPAVDDADREPFAIEERCGLHRHGNHLAGGQ